VRQCSTRSGAFLDEAIRATILIVALHTYTPIRRAGRRSEATAPLPGAGAHTAGSVVCQSHATVIAATMRSVYDRPTSLCALLAAPSGLTLGGFSFARRGRRRP
jgi:hypothetical protein